jgi:hypothetical protein
MQELCTGQTEESNSISQTKKYKNFIKFYQTYSYMVVVYTDSVELIFQENLKSMHESFVFFVCDTCVLGCNVLLDEWFVAFCLHL